MKNYFTALAAACCLLAFAACGDNGNSEGSAKQDTLVNPQDNTNAVSSDTTTPANAPNVDTVGAGRSTSSGIKDTGKHK
ncbi:MAG TPA: hypothetical protein VHB48_00665 [Chitinophagaceae bacterium]|jgi:hypothetical protein|nr:hypothetical protein [Chitinophagaceae bacterium]